MCKIRIGLFLIAVMICTLSILPAQAAHTSIFGDAITSSIEEVKRYFDMTKQDKVSTTTESGVPVIYMQAAEVGHWIISKDSVDLSAFTYTVNVAFGEGVGREVSIFVGADSRYFNGFQVYLSKRGSNLVFVKAAELIDGNYTKVLEETVLVDNGDSSETYYKIQLQIKDSDMAVYLNDEYISSVHIEKGFKGRVGVRCTGQNNVVAVSDLRIKELSLTAGISEIDPDAGTANPGMTAAPQKTPGSSATIDTTKAPTKSPTEHSTSETETTQQPTQGASDTNNSEEFPILLVGGTVLVTVICTCAIILAAYMVIKKKAN